jgi:hypothetical protein
MPTTAATTAGKRNAQRYSLPLVARPSSVSSLVEIEQPIAISRAKTLRSCRDGSARSPTAPGSSNPSRFPIRRLGFRGSRSGRRLISFILSDPFASATWRGEFLPRLRSGRAGVRLRHLNSARGDDLLSRSSDDTLGSRRQFPIGAGEG